MCTARLYLLPSVYLITCASVFSPENWENQSVIVKNKWPLHIRWVSVRMLRGAPWPTDLKYHLTRVQHTISFLPSTFHSLKFLLTSYCLLPLPEAKCHRSWDFILFTPLSCAPKLCHISKCWISICWVNNNHCYLLSTSAQGTSLCTWNVLTHDWINDKSNLLSAVPSTS